MVGDGSNPVSRGAGPTTGDTTRVTIANDVSIGGGTQYAEGTVVATPTGTVALGQLATNAVQALSLDTNGNLNVNVQTGGGGSVTGALTDGSGTTSATPSTSAQIFAANSTRNYFFIQNNGTTTIWINFGVAAVATQPSIQITPTGSYIMENRFVSNQTVNVLSTVASQAFTAKQG